LIDYRWLLFLHVGSVLVFMLAHGVQVTAAWKMRWEADPAEIGSLFAPLPLTRWLRYTLLGVLITGVVLVAFLNIWTSAWIWLSLGLLAVIWALMYVWGGAFLTAIEETCQAAVEAAGTSSEADARAAFDRARRSWLVPAMTVVGLGGVGVILWLMIFKPF
jgi:hypothetical protein